MDYCWEVRGGSVALLRPITPAARENLERHVGPESQWLGMCLAVEHRYVESLTAQLTEEGWTVR